MLFDNDPVEKAKDEHVAKGCRGPWVLWKAHFNGVEKAWLTCERCGERIKVEAVAEDIESNG